MLSVEQRKFLEPLSEWRILDIESLTLLSNTGRNYESAKKLLQRLHKKCIVEFYRDPWNKKNYIYLTPKGIGEVNPDLKPLLNTGALFHDSKVTTLGLLISKLKNVFKKVQLEHEIKNGKSFQNLGDHIPDARVLGEFKKSNFEAAVELELTPKEKSRIIEKAKYYLESKYYNHAFYFFPSPQMAMNYYKTLKESLGIEFNNKIFLFSNPLLLKAKPTLDYGAGLVQNKEKSFLDVFGGVV